MVRSINRRRSPQILLGHQVLLKGGRVVLLCVLLALAAAAGGCRRGSMWGLAAVEGTVTKGGRPLQGVEVVFLPDSDAGTVGPRAVGRTDEVGRYSLRTDNGEDGAAVGNYRVLVLAPEVRNLSIERFMGGPRRKEARLLSPEMAKRLEERQKTTGNAPQVPLSYRHFDETPLRVEVRSGSPVLDLEVK